MNGRRLLVAALCGMVAAAVLLGTVLGWRYASGPANADGPPSVRVLRLLPGTFMWANAPADARYLPAGLRPHDAARLKLLVLRGEDGAVRAFWLPRHGGRIGVPADASPAAPGIPCNDFAPDFRTGDIGCRQPLPGFEFALRHRWSLQGRALSAGTLDLVGAAGRETDGDWVLQAP
ncbi:hypothetical protein [Ottowia testudinis]|uniref:Uncharacterized protein n=1 Tax=Ottowia testudinis TaxID=2816950 RepID=A0A975CC89_9BURK|nr:hypothetical protein [Ottowia testudinis]QTD43730.1 hypothetical protein J1M35_11210 [Ottowia testudinis]